MQLINVNGRWLDAFNMVPAISCFKLVEVESIIVVWSVFLDFACARWRFVDWLRSGGKGGHDRSSGGGNVLHHLRLVRGGKLFRLMLTFI